MSRELLSWLILTAVAVGVSVGIYLSGFGGLRYDCPFDDQVMGSDSTCYDVDGFLDAGFEEGIQR